MAYLITCSSAKNSPKKFDYKESSIDKLSFPELNVIRNNLIEFTGINLDWNYTLPAWKLYSGVRSRLYPQINEYNWVKPCVKIKILSALFGWINHTDLIPWYDLKIDHKLSKNNLFVYNIWNQDSILKKYIEPEDVDLLSVIYRRAISPNGIINCSTPNVIFTDRGVQKGIWLNSQLEIISC
jgi:cytoplasmic iron level regulating protein YaaA (DUF328/UPF0246 family)